MHQDISSSGEGDLMPLVFPQREKPERIILADAEDGPL
jgi:hypothetical protein